jgi:hypothetical protein
MFSARYQSDVSSAPVSASPALELESAVSAEVSCAGVARLTIRFC